MPERFDTVKGIIFCHSQSGSYAVSGNITLFIPGKFIPNGTHVICSVSKVTDRITYALLDSVVYDAA